MLTSLFGGFYCQEHLQHMRPQHQIQNQKGQDKEVYLFLILFGCKFIKSSGTQTITNSWQVSKFLTFGSFSMFHLGMLVPWPSDLISHNCNIF